MSYRVFTGTQKSYPAEKLLVLEPKYASLTGIMPAPPQKEKARSSKVIDPSLWVVPVTSKMPIKTASPNSENIVRKSRSLFSGRTSKVVPISNYDNPTSEGGKKKAAPKKKAAVKAAPKKTQ